MSNAAPGDDVWTVQRILSWTTDYLADHGIQSARLEAELLCAHARQCPRIRLYTDLDFPLSHKERIRMREYVRRRAHREPLAYITGRREFYGRNFEVGPGILIPRPETETLIDLALEKIPKEIPSTIAEVGFGSGCIAITLAAQRPKCHIVATDTSHVCLQYARRNADALNVSDRVGFVPGDGLNPIRELAVSSEFDGLVSNPPYICEHELPGLQPEVSQHEPAEALVSGSEGLDFIRGLIPEAAGVLRPGAWIALECDPAQCAIVAQLMNASGFVHPQIHRDHRDVDRIVTAVKQESLS